MRLEHAGTRLLRGAFDSVSDFICGIVISLGAIAQPLVSHCNWDNFQARATVKPTRLFHSTRLSDNISCDKKTQLAELAAGVAITQSF